MAYCSTQAPSCGKPADSLKIKKAFKYHSCLFSCKFFSVIIADHFSKQTQKVVSTCTDYNKIISRIEVSTKHGQIFNLRLKMISYSIVNTCDL